MLVWALALHARHFMNAIHARKAGLTGPSVAAGAGAGDDVVSRTSRRAFALVKEAPVSTSGTLGATLGPVANLTVGLVGAGAGFSFAIAVQRLAAFARKRRRADASIRPRPSRNLTRTASSRFATMSILENLEVLAPCALNQRLLQTSREFARLAILDAFGFACTLGIGSVNLALDAPHFLGTFTLHVEAVSLA